MAKIVDPQKVFCYKYRCEDCSLLTPHLKKHFWSKVVLLVPQTVAPNVLTLLANLCSLLSFFFLVFFLEPSAEHNPLLFFLPALGIFLYHTLDNIDGSHAVRTGSSSPLGEFLDHWFDAGNVLFLPLGFAYAFGFSSIQSVLLALTGTLAYWATLWEQRKTGKLLLGRISQVEGIILLLFLYLSAVFLGRGMFDFSFFSFDGKTLLASFAIIGFSWETLHILRRHKQDWKHSLGIGCSLGLIFLSFLFLQHQEVLSAKSSLLFAVLLGFVGWKHIGDNQRAHLIGAAFKPYDVGVLFFSVVLLLSSIFLPHASFFSLSLPMVLVLLFLSWVSFLLLYQYVHTTRHITRHLGIRVLSLKRKEALRNQP